MVWEGLVVSEANIAVLGAGAAGIASFIALRRAGFQNITVFEATSNIGGTWVYSPETENAHSSMYRSLRVNIPKQAMCFLDTPFRDDIPSFPGHADVAGYLQKVAEDNQMPSCVRFNTRVACISPQNPNDFCTGWLVQTLVSNDGWHPKSIPAHDNANGNSRRTKQELSDPEYFHAVFVCCGHYSDASPWRPENAIEFPGNISHSHLYRTPTPFFGKKVVVIGAGPSGTDIALELMNCGVDVLLSRANADGSSKYGGIVPEVATVVRCLSDSSVVLENGDIIPNVDELLLCTGYSYNLSFLTEECGLRVTEDTRAINGLFMHCLSAAHPTLAVIGMVFKVVPFPLFEDQAAFVAALLRAQVPFDVSQETVSQLLSAEKKGRDPSEPEKYLHCLNDRQWDYRRTLAGWSGRRMPSECVKEIYNDSRTARANNPVTYRNREYKVLGDGPGQWRVIMGGKDITGLIDSQERAIK